MFSGTEPGARRLYRAVEELELTEILRQELYTMQEGCAGKYFYPTLEKARQFVKEGWAVAVTSAVFPEAALADADVIEPAGEGRALYLPGRLFPHGPVRVEPLHQTERQSGHEA